MIRITPRAINPQSVKPKYKCPGVVPNRNIRDETRGREPKRHSAPALFFA